MPDPTSTARHNSERDAAMCAHAGMARPYLVRWLRRAGAALPVPIMLALVLPLGAHVAPARAAACPDEGAREKQVHGLALPDCRAYEQVSPVDKNGADARGFPGSVASSPSGGRVRYWSLTPFAVPEGCALAGGNPDYISSRGAKGGWSTEGVLPCEAPEGGKLGFSEDLSETLVWDRELALSAGAPSAGISYYLRYGEPPASGRYRLLASVSGVGIEEDYFVVLAGFSGDDSHLIFETLEPLLKQARAGAPNLYEVDLGKPVGEQLSLVGLLPPGEGRSKEEAPPGGSVAGAGARKWPSFLSHPNGRVYTQSAISRDGSRVFFTALPSERVYLRENAGAPPSPLGGGGECLVAVDACTVTVSQGAAHFREATPDGAYAFYTEGEDLYRFDVESGEREVIAAPVTPTATGNITLGSKEVTSLEVKSGEFHVGEVVFGVGLSPCRCTTVTAVGEHSLTLSLDAEETLSGVAMSGSPGGALGVLGIAGDGRAVYYAATGMLAANANSWGETAANEPKVVDVYEWYRPAAGPAVTTFIARLDNPDNEGAGDEEDWTDALGQRFPVERSARVTGDGGTLLFSSRRPLTGYNNGNGGCGGAACSELFRYRAGVEGGVGRLTCVSCNPDRKVPPVNDALLTGKAEGAGESAEPVLTRNLSESGGRVFFDSADPLVAGDSDTGANPSCKPEGNEVTGCDVYEWEADGEGGCHSESVDEGCLYLISSGTSPEQSYFGDASASGNDVFFFTRQALAPSDEDSSVDVYDARVCESGDSTCAETPGGSTGQPPPCSGKNAPNPPARRHGSPRWQPAYSPAPGTSPRHHRWDPPRNPPRGR